MTSEAYRLGFKHGTEGTEPILLGCPWKQEQYNSGYEDGRRARGALATHMPALVWRRGC